MGSLSSIIQKALLSKGYFPKELPPVFTTSDFGHCVNPILSDWESGGIFKIKSAKEFSKVDGKRLRGKSGFSKIPNAEPETISKPKKIYERRNIHIVHPVPQALLVREIAENWHTIQKWLSRQAYSEDEVIISDNYDRAIKGINFQLHRAKTNFIEATADWLVKTDITRFYPSLYTHSLSWAAYGKEAVKNDLRKYDGSLADRLDVLVRSCNRNQTVGIPIGPETSRILAEIVSSRIDHDFSNYVQKVLDQSVPKRRKLFDKNTVDRLQDDWTVGTSSLERAENILSIITKCYREYGLEINGSKTSVTHLMKSEGISWKSEIAAFLSHRQGVLHGQRLVEFLALCLRLQLEVPNAPVLNYSLSIVEGRRFEIDDLHSVETFLLKAAAIAPNSLDRICRIVLNLNHETGKLSKGRFVARFIELAERHIENGSLYEVIWLLYTVRGLRQPFLSKRIVEFSEYVQSSALRLLLLDMDQLRLCIKSLPKKTWESEISADRCLKDWTWLYSYESVRKGWLHAPASFLNSPFLKPMHTRNVNFYNPRRNIARSKSVKKIAASIRKADKIQVTRLVSQLRGIEHIFDFDFEY
ncbi:MAG: RNA-directed DNA polymerase [Beijerinckiaceae bacterium]